MLVLTRSLHSGDPDKASIIIGHDVEIRVVEVRGDKVRVGIAAPRSKPVHRKEVYQQIQQEQREQAASRAEGHDA